MTTHDKDIPPAPDDGEAEAPEVPEAPEAPDAPEAEDAEDAAQAPKAPEAPDAPSAAPGLGLTPQEGDGEPGDTGNADGAPGPTPSGFGSRAAWIAAGGAVAVLLALAVALWALRPATGPAPVTPEVARQAAPAPDAPVPAEAPAPRAVPQDGPLPYEETLGVPLERLVRQIDYALIETLLFTGYDPHAMTIREMRLVTYHDERYHYQLLDIELEKGPDRFVGILEKSLAKWAPEAALTQVDERAWEVSVAGRVTHRLEFAAAQPRPAQVAGGARMAVVIDDLGQDLRAARTLAALPFPVTFAVLPGTPHGREVAALAREAGREVLLHLPMEPKGWPDVNPGPGALFTSMDEGAIRAALDGDLALVPGAMGVNNHMGSRFTGDAAGMRVVLGELKRRGLFFLDSLTAPDSVGVTEAKTLGLPVYRRSIFLDNIRDVGAVTRQLERARRIAAGTGQAIAIGHPYPETLAALQKWAETGDRQVRIVTVKELRPLQ